MDRIATVEAIPVSYPEPNDFNALRHLCLVKVTTQDGVVGWGESITQFPEANFATKAIIEGMAERVVGKDPLENIAIWYALRDQKWWYGYNGGIASYAVAAIDMALWDIKGKLLGTSVLNLLGGAVHEKLPVGRLLPRPLRRHRRDGRGGTGVGRARTARRQGRLRQARRRQARLRARPRRRVHPPHARGPGTRPADHDRLRLEREVGRHDRRPPRAGVRGVRPALDRGAAPRVGPGGLRQPAQQDHEPDRLRREGVGPAPGSGACWTPARWTSIGIDPGRAEGITGFKKATEMVERARRQSNAHAWSSAICSAASLAISFSTPSAKLFEFKPLRNPMQHDLVTEPFEHVDGWVYPPTKPGLGIEIIEEVVERYRSEKVLADPPRSGRSARPAAVTASRSRTREETDMTWSVGAGLEGRGVIVTGAAGGIGKAVAEAFATTGARVMAVDLDQARVDEVVAGFEGTGHVGVAADLGDLSGHGASSSAPARSSAACTRWPTWRPSCAVAAAWTRSPRMTGTSSTTSTSRPPSS